MSDIIQNLLNDVLQDGARATKYRCEITLPTTFGTHEKNLDVICKAANFPTKFNEVIMIKHKGRDIPIPGQEKFTHVMDLTFYLDGGHKYRILFEEWMQSLNWQGYHEKYSGKVNWNRWKQYSDLSAGKGNIKLTQLNFDSDTDKVAYNFYNVFPREISQVQMGSETVSSILEFTVTFSFTHYIIEKKASDGSNSNDVSNKILNEVQDAATGIVSSALGFIPGLDSLDSAASKANTAIQDAGKSIATSINEFLG